MSDDEREAAFLDTLRRGGWRSGTGMTRPPEPETNYPQAWGSAQPPAAQSHADSIRTAQGTWDSRASVGYRCGAMPSTGGDDYRPSMDYPEIWAPTRKDHP